MIYTEEVAIMLLLLCCLDPVVGYERDNAGLTSFPHDIGSTETTISLRDNDIVEVDYIGMISVKFFKMHRNKLSAFPNFFNVSATLRKIYLNSNRISYINPTYLDPLVKLISLTLSGNLLTSVPDSSGPVLFQLILSHNQFDEFPDLFNLGRTLEELHLVGNSHISTIPSSKMVPLTSIKKIMDLSNLGLTEVPDLTPMMSTIESFIIKKNYISEFGTSQFDKLVELKQLDVDENQLEMLPNVCARNSSVVVAISATENPIRYHSVTRAYAFLYVISSLKHIYMYIFLILVIYHCTAPVELPFQIC